MYQNGDGSTPPPPAEDESESEKNNRERPLRRRIVSMGATGLTQGQKNWSIFKIDLLAICWALEHSKYYCINAMRVIVKTNHTPKKGL